MERVTSFLSVRSSRSRSTSPNNNSSSTLQEKTSSLPSPPSYPKSRLRMRSILGSCLGRRAIIWAFAVIFITSLLFFRSSVYTRNGDVVTSDGLIISNGPAPGAAKGQQGSKPQTGEEQQNMAEDGDDNDENAPPGPVWIRYKHLNGFFNGLKALVPYQNHTAEWPNPSYQGPITAVSLSHDRVPTPQPYRPQPDYESDAYLAEHPPVNECFLDDDDTSVPDLYAYQGLPQSQPDPAIGDYNLLGIRDDVCFDRFGRYGPYGLGYGADQGGTGEGLDTEMEGADTVWAKTGKIDYTNVDWGEAQERCSARNNHRFRNVTEAETDPTNEHQPEKGVKKLQRMAVVVRTYVGFRWTQHVILNFRAMISELSLKSGGEYTVHFLLHVKDLNAAIWADPRVVQDILDANVPAEFHSICTLWSEAQMRLYYPGTFTEPFENPSHQDIHGVYRSAHMPLQVFALQHPEYEHFWNWELDMRYTGSYYELFDRSGAWAKEQTRNLIWERSSKYYIPPLHGSWDDFSRLVEQEVAASGKRPIMGPLLFPGRQSIYTEKTPGGREILPDSCRDPENPLQCGVGEEADIITMNPLFDTDESGWVFSKDVTGYNTHLKIPPRRCAIVTASRLSRRLILAMHEETWRHHHSMFSEMFPPTMALHHGLKGVYAPHPVFLDRGWRYNRIEQAFNGGRDGTSSGPGSPFDLKNEHNHKGTSWYYNSEFAGLMWRRWLGYSQMDGRGDDGGRAGGGTLRGGKKEEESDLSSGRMCLRSMLVHPIKHENPAEKA